MSRTEWLTKASAAAVDWKMRHVIVMIAGAALTYAFLESRTEWSAMHRWNRAIGDASLILLVFAMAIGPLARLWPFFRRLLPWRRETGVYSVILAFVHTAIILFGWVEWDLILLFGYEFHPGLGQYVMVAQGFALANTVGFLALIYGLVLMASSNNRALRYLGGRTWKFLQQGSYILWLLVVMHTAYFLYLHFLDFHRPLPDPNWAQVPFAAVVAAVFVLQVAAFVKTWRARRGGRPQTLDQSEAESLAT